MGPPVLPRPLPAAAPLSLSDQHALMRRATRLSLAVASGLLLLKGAAWWRTGSVAMLASLLDSLVDVLASAVTAWAVHASLQPADREHRFGHGKLEPLAGLGQALLITASAVGLAISAIGRLITPQPVQAEALGLVVMAVASLATLGLVRYQRHVVRHTGSTAVEGDSLHYRGDLLMNLAVALSLAASAWTGWQIADPLLGLGVAFVIAAGAWGIGNRAIQLLMDVELTDSERATIQELVRQHPAVSGLHDLRTRKSGAQTFIQFHLELPGHLTVTEAHRIGAEVEARLLQAFPGAEVLIHEDPEDAPTHDVV